MCPRRHPFPPRHPRQRPRSPEPRQRQAGAVLHRQGVLRPDAGAQGPADGGRRGHHQGGAGEAPPGTRDRAQGWGTMSRVGGRGLAVPVVPAASPSSSLPLPPRSCPRSPSTSCRRRRRSTPTPSWCGARRSTRTRATTTTSSPGCAPPSTGPSPCGKERGRDPTAGLYRGGASGAPDPAATSPAGTRGGSRPLPPPRATRRRT